MKKRAGKSAAIPAARVSGKTILAGSILAMMSGTAFADVRIGGKFDAGYQFKHTANIEVTDGVVSSALNQGGVTTEVLGDGGASTSRITVGANEDLGDGMSAYIDLDLRFGNVHEGKTGLNSNDKKVMGLVTPFGKFAWGTYNITNLNIAEKPYMVSPKDMEIVKFGISQARESDLTNRNTEYTTPTFNIGNSKLLFKANYAFGDKRKAGDNNNDSTAARALNSGDASSVGVEGVVGDFMSWTTDIVKRQSSSVVLEDGMVITHNHINIRPLKGLKFSASYNVFKGRNPNISNAAGGSAFREKNTNYVVSYNWNDKLEIGLEISHLNDVGSNRNSGRGFMLGGAYFLAKGTYLYLATSKQDFARNESITGGKYDGTNAGFSNVLKKNDEHYTRFGVVKEF